MRGEQRLGRKVIDKVARQLAATFPTDRLAAQASDALAHARGWPDFQAKAQVARDQAAAFLGELHLPQMPSLDQLRRLAEGGSRARRRWTRSPAAPARSCSRQ